MTLTSVTRKLSCDVNDFKWIQSCHAYDHSFIYASSTSSPPNFHYLHNNLLCNFHYPHNYLLCQVRDLDGSCVEKFKLPKKTSQCTDPIIDNGNAFMTSSRIVQVCITLKIDDAHILVWCDICQQNCGVDDDHRKKEWSKRWCLQNCVLLVKFVTQCVSTEMLGLTTGSFRLYSPICMKLYWQIIRISHGKVNLAQ